MFLESILIGIVSWTFVHILIAPEMIFSKWWVVLNSLPEYFAKPLGKCEYCLGGQIALWYYLFSYGFNLVNMVAFISVAIFTCKTINRLIYGIETS